MNRNRNDNRIENLAFLCFEHHDRFDSKTSQSKNFTRKEVIRYRDQLAEHFKDNFVLKKPKAEASLTPSCTGLFARKSGLEGGANFSITFVDRNWDGRRLYMVLGQACEGTQRPYGPNMGFLSFSAPENDRVIEYADGKYTIMIGFFGNRLLIEEENEFGYFGAGVHFFGEYERIQSLSQRMAWWIKSQWIYRFKHGNWPD